MERTKTIVQCGITSLRITAEDMWLKQHISTKGDGIFASPQYQYLIGDYYPMFSWMNDRRLPPEYITKKLMEVMKSIIEEGQREPIKIYQDMRINTGHKRAACLAFLGRETIKAEIVPDDYKL